MKKLHHGMVLAAGRGDRMRPISDTIPKPLIEIGGRSMLDRMLDRMENLDSVVVNAWHLPQQIAAAVGARQRPDITLSREETRLDTGGGVANALAHLGSDVFAVANGDVLLHEPRKAALATLAEAWDGEAMDALLLLVARENAGGFRGAGDFFTNPAGRLERRGDAASAPYVYASLQLVHPRLLANSPGGAFSFNLLWDRALKEGRLFGAVHDGGWYTVDTPANIEAAEAWLSENP
jgi:N-acetyl-alpha-D-muramate 1-phosphate uridylyltransferase